MVCLVDDEKPALDIDAGPATKRLERKEHYPAFCRCGCIRPHVFQAGRCNNQNSLLAARECECGIGLSCADRIREQCSTEFVE